MGGQHGYNQLPFFDKAEHVSTINPPRRLPHVDKVDQCPTATSRDVHQESPHAIYCRVKIILAMEIVESREDTTKLLTANYGLI